jgi:hypothetical protein
MRIWKAVLEVTDRQVVSVPVGAKFLSSQIQGNALCLWFLCDEKRQLEPRVIAIYGTGNPIPDEPGDYIATFQMHGGDLVFHVFEI